MNKLAIDNLSAIIKAGYKYICLSTEDLQQFLNIPWENKNFYPTKDWKAYAKRGWFKTENGMVMVWDCHSQPRDHIKVSEETLPNDEHSPKVWSDPIKFSEANGAERVAKILKLKVFW
jgi:hypothetical protein